MDDNTMESIVVDQADIIEQLASMLHSVLSELAQYRSVDRELETLKSVETR